MERRKGEGGMGGGWLLSKKVNTELKGLLGMERRKGEGGMGGGGGGGVIQESKHGA